MALGTLGSTLNDELNRLANGGTYRDMNQMVDEALAAKQWANRENINPYSTDTVGILNEIAGLGLDKKNWLDFNGVCNYIAGTTGLPAAAALRQVYPTTDLLTGVASYYVDAVDSQLGGGYLYLPGVAGNYASRADAAAVDITGDIDLRAKVALDDWGVNAILIAKWISSGNQRSYSFANIGRNLRLQYSPDGTSFSTVDSTVTHTIPSGSTIWVRATLDVDNGASGHDVKFFTSTDGTTWTQLGATVTTAFVTSLFNSTSALEIGVRNTGTDTFAKGKFYRAQILNGIGGTTVFDANFETAMTSQTVTSFTESSSNAATVTINRNTYNFQLDTINNLGAAGSLLPTTLGSSTAADSNDPKFLDFTGTNYVYLPGVNSNYLSVPDAANLRITGDIDLRCQVALDDWTPSTAQCFISKRLTNANYQFDVRTSGVLGLTWYDTTAGAFRDKVSTVAPTVTDGSVLWVRVTLDVDNGASGNDVKFFTSSNGITWTQLGATVTTAGIATPQTGTDNVEIGSYFAGTGIPLAGKIFRAQIFNGIDGTKVLDVDTSTLQTGADAYIVPTTYSGAAGAFFTGTGLSLPGTTGNYVSTPDASQLDITGDIDIAVQVALADWTPSAISMLLAKWDGASNRSYFFYVNTDGKLNASVSTTGANQISYFSSVATGISDGATKWVRFTRVASTGVVKFFTSDDATTWTQLGTDVSGTSGNIFSGTSILEVGSYISGQLPANGTFYRAVVKSGIDGFPVFDATFVGVPANSLRMIESSTYKAVVTLNTTRYCTINRSTSGRKTVAVTQPTWLFGTDDYMEVNNRYTDHLPASENYVYLNGVAANCMSVADNPPLDISGDLDIQIRLALDNWTAGSIQALVTKWGYTTSQRAYGLWIDTNNTLRFGWSANGTTSNIINSTVAPTLTNGVTTWLRVTLDVDNGAGGNDIKFFTSTNGTTWTQLGSTVTNSGTASIFNSNAQVTVGATRDGGPDNPSKGRFYRAIIKNGIDGTTVLDANTAVITTPTQTTFTDSSSNAYTVTINRSGVGSFVSTNNYLYLPGVSGNYASAPDSAALDITGDIDIRCKVALDDWTPSVDQTLITKMTTSLARSYDLRVISTAPIGALNLLISTDGTNQINASSTVATGITDGSTKWVRATRVAATGVVQFFTSDDGTNWTQLGTDVSTTAGNIFNSTSALEVGSRFLGASLQSRGKFFRAQVLNGINGTVAFDANFETSITSLNQASFTESSANAATVTINRSGSAYRSAGITTAGYLYPGATNTFTASATNFLDFGASQDFTILWTGRTWNTQAAFRDYIGKTSSVGGVGSWTLESNNNTLSSQFWISSTGVAGGATTTARSNGQIATLFGIANRTTNLFSINQNGVSGSTGSLVGVGTLENFGTVRIGVDTGSFQDFEFVSAAVFRQVLSTAQIRQIVNYFANREVYL